MESTTRHTKFRDAEADDEAWMQVEAGVHGVALTVSLRHDGDYTIGLPPEAARWLIAALTEALAQEEG